IAFPKLLQQQYSEPVTNNSKYYSGWKHQRQVLLRLETATTVASNKYYKQQRVVLL
ncbi:hypothetical protein GIB67_027194, partial [Kingdonia uniflora]